MSKDVVTRALREDRFADRVRPHPDGEDIVRLILGGSVAKARIDRKTTSIFVLAAIGVRRDGQKILLAIRTWAARAERVTRFLGDLHARGPKVPEFHRRRCPGQPEAALVEHGLRCRSKRCTVHKHRNLPRPRARDSCTATSPGDYRDMDFAARRAEIEVRRKVFPRK